MSVVGQSRPRIDAVERVTGAARYTGDVKLPGMAYARVLRSPHPHARITGIDARRARAMPGVYAVLTRENCDTVWRSGDQQNPRYLFNNPVRFVGDPIAAVAAVDRHVAEAAIQAVEVDYEPLDFVLDPEEALQPGAVEIQPGGNLSRRRDGEALPETYQRGSVAAGFAAADVVIEETYVSKHHSNAQMEPRSAGGALGGRRTHPVDADPGYLELPLRRGAGSRPAARAGAGGLRVHGRWVRQQEPVSGRRSHRGAPRAAGGGVRSNWSADAEGRLSRGPRPLADGAALPGGSRARRHAAGDPAPRFQRDGPHRKSGGGIAGIELFRCPNVRREVSPVYTNMTVAANFRGPGLSPRGLGHRIGHGSGGP